MELRVCKDLFWCCSNPIDPRFEYSLPNYKDGAKQRFKVKECKIEPGDINWENLRIVGCEKHLRTSAFLAIVLIVSALSFASMI